MKRNAKNFLFALLLLKTSLYSLTTTDLKNPLVSGDKKEQILSSFPRTTDEVAIFAEKAKEDFSNALNAFLAIPATERTFKNTIASWDQMGRDFMNKLIVLKFTDTVTANQDAHKASEKKIQELVSFLFQKLRDNPQTLYSILSFVENELEKNHLTSGEWFEVSNLIESIPLEDIPSPFKENIITLQDKISKMDPTPYTYYPGLLKNKEISKGKPFTLLNLNVCFLEENQPLLFGGVLPWSVRIQKITEEIEKFDPDVLCLQEVFDEKAGQVLLEALQGKYAHFYLKTGPRNMGFSQSAMGLSSGLFVASKFAVKDPHFTLFKGVTSSVNRGVFDFTIQSRASDIAHIYTTHLEAWKAPEFREVQLTEILQKMEKDLKNQKKQIPIILCGDLNIDWNSQESAEKLLNRYFFDPYNRSHKGLTMGTRTSVDYTDYWWKAKEDVKQFIEIPQILDYTLLLIKKPFSDQNYGSFWKKAHKKMQTKVVSMNAEEHPLSALTDHHGQLSKIYPN